jgi:hypothetical protein
MSQETTQPQAASQPFVAHAGKTYRRYRYVMFVLMVGFGCAFLYDGFIRWPAQNDAWNKVETQIQLLETKPQMRKELDDLRAKQKGMTRKHTDFDLRLQCVLGFALPPLAVCVLILWLRRSRGEYRLENDILHVPGYPPIPLNSIDSLDKTRWDRKGIAFASYKLPNGKTGIVRLDDFIYEAYPIRDMVKCIEESILARARAQQRPSA